MVIRLTGPAGGVNADFALADNHNKRRSSTAHGA